MLPVSRFAVNRRRCCAWLAAAWSGAAAPADAGPLLARRIPSTGDSLPAIGLGSWITFNVGADRVLRRECAEVVKAFLDGGGRMIDSSPMYGSSQSVIGEALAALPDQQGGARRAYACDRDAHFVCHPPRLQAVPPERPAVPAERPGGPAMTEWWTYRPSDFLMFSPRVYARLIEAANAEAWPLQWLGAAAAMGLLVLLLRRDDGAGRMALCVLAVGWGSVALFFHARHFATINTAAPVFAWAFGLQALLLLALAGWRTELRWVPRPGPRRAAVLLLAALAAACPLAAPLLGRPWSQAECFGLLPDPTVLATLAVLLRLRLRAGLALLCWSMPVLWCTVAVLLQWTLHESGAGG